MSCAFWSLASGTPTPWVSETPQAQSRALGGLQAQHLPTSEHTGSYVCSLSFGGQM